MRARARNPVLRQGNQAADRRFSPGLKYVRKICRSYGVVFEALLSPLRGLLVSRLVYPRLASWAVFFRRSAAAFSAALVPQFIDKNWFWRTP